MWFYKICFFLELKNLELYHQINQLLKSVVIFAKKLACPDSSPI